MGKHFAGTVFADLDISRNFVSQSCTQQCAKKGASNFLGLVDFAVGTVSFTLCLPGKQVKFLRRCKIDFICTQGGLTS